MVTGRKFLYGDFIKVVRSKKSKRIILLLGLLLALFGLSILLVPLDLEKFTSDYSVIIKAEENELLRVFLNSKEQYCFPLNTNYTIGFKLESAVLTFEDKSFYYHFGFNPVSILRALFLNLKEQRIISGGSTITMQLARMINNSPRTYLNKFKELLMAVKLECLLKKQEILKLYLAHAPYGGNIRGIEAASLRYFGKNQQELSWAEAALLAVLPNSPGSITPYKQRKALLEKRNRLLKQLFDNNSFTKEALKLSLAEKIPDERFNFPFKAPHFTDFIRTEFKKNNSPLVETTLNLTYQQNIEKITNLHMSNLKNNNVNNCAVLVLDAKTGEIKSYLGSNNYYDRENYGQVDCITSFRSTGSTLKPFLYALALDEGLIVPESKLIDVPSHFGSFSPANSTNKYSGIIEAKSALAASLNIPAVFLLKEYGLEKFYRFLANSDVQGLRSDPAEYGLTLILGGAEIRMFDLAKLYLNLASLEKCNSIKYLRSSQKTQKQTQEFSKGAAYLTLEMLSSLKRPGLDYYWNYFSMENKIAWKTGTSFGGKDAWACGVTPDWVVLVWAGNFSGEGIPEISGFKTTAPLMFNIFDYLLEQKDSGWFKFPDKDLREVKASRVSGYRLKDDFRTKENWVNVLQPAKAKPLKLSPYEHKIWLNQNEKEVCSLCWNQKENIAHDSVLIIYPPVVNNFLKNNNLQIKSYPEHYAECPGLQEKIKPVIIYPQNGSKIYLPINLKEEKEQIIIKCSHNIADEKLFWHLNGNFLGTTSKLHNFKLKLKKGKYTLYICDSKGNEAKSVFYITNN